MRFLVDAQLPPALARWIESQGYPAEHVFDRLGVDAEDQIIWEYAAGIDATILTKDEDFFILKTLRQDGPSIVWIRVGNTRRAALLDWFGRLFPSIVGAIEQGEQVIEVGP